MPFRSPRILFLTHPYPNYVPDLLLLGLREILGANVVDYPEKVILTRGQLTGIALQDDLCPDLTVFDDALVDRSDLAAKVKNGFFDFVVADFRAVAPARELFPEMPKKFVLIDGEDQPAFLERGPYILFRRETNGTDGAFPLPMALPRKIFEWIQSYKTEPKKYSVGFIGSYSSSCPERKSYLEEVANKIPNSLIELAPIPTEENPRPQGRFGRAEYYRKLQSCKVVLSFRGAGFDTFRFWENMAFNGIHVAEKSPILMPKPFVDGVNISYFADSNGLIEAVNRALSNERSSSEFIARAHKHLSEAHFTNHRAEYFIERVSAIFN